MVFDRIHDAMCLNKMSRTSSRNVGPKHKKYSIIFHCTHGVLCISVFNKPILSVCWKAIFLVTSDHRSQSHLKFQSCLTTEYAEDCVWMKAFSFLSFFFLKPTQTTCGVGAVWFYYIFLRFSDSETQLFSAILSCDPWRVFRHSSSPPQRALGRYRHTYSFVKCSVDWKCLIIALMVETGIFTALFFEVQLSFAAQKYILWLFSLWWMIKGIWDFLLFYLYSYKTGSNGWIFPCS